MAWMVATVQAHCWACGLVRMPSTAIDLRVCGNQRALSTYGFDCPSCRQRIETPACEHAIAALYSVGVRATVWHVPAEALEAHDGPPLSVDDLLDLHEQLAAI